MKRTNVFQKIISGGQNGADLAALKSAKKNGIQTGGYVPSFFHSFLKATYGLSDKGCTASNSPFTHAQALISRSKANVDESDATIAFRTKSSSGTDKTIQYAFCHKWQDFPPDFDCSLKSSTTSTYKPLLIVEHVEPIDLETNVKTICEFLLQHSVSVVNVCGHRDDITSGIVQFEDKVFQIMDRVCQFIVCEK